MEMPGAYWYYGLVVISLILFAVAFHFRKDWKLLILHLSVYSVIHPFEVIVTTTGGYNFTPGILPTSADSILGAYISDLLIIPASAVIISAFSLSWHSMLCFAAIFTGVDWYFTTLGIYQHFWWKSIYTGLGLIFLYLISDWLWTGLNKYRQSLSFRLLIIHLTYFALQSSITFAVNRGGQLFIMQIPYVLFGNPIKMQVILISLYQLIVSAIVVVCLGLKMPCRYRFAGIGGIFLLNWAIGYFGIFVPQVSISPYHLIFIPFVTVILLIILFRAAKLDYLFP